VRDERLLAVLAAAHIEEVDLIRRHGVAKPDRAHVEFVPARLRTLGEHCDVAAVRVDVQVVGIEMPDADLHAADSQ